MKIAVITGASSGMGREFAIQLSHEANFDEMWVIARRKEALESLKDQVCCPIRPIAMDLLNPDSFQRYADLLDMVQPEIKVLVNCAGFGKFGRYDQIPLQDCMNMIDLNCKALVAMTQLSLPLYAPGRQNRRIGLPVRVPACAIPQCIRLHQGFRPQLQPRPESGAEVPGHPGHGREPRVG